MKEPRLFPGMIFGLLGLNFVLVGSMLFFAHSDRSFAVEPEYYQKAIAWDETAAQQQFNTSLAWSPAISLGDVGALGRIINLSLTDRAGNPIPDARITITAFHNARASDRLTAELSPVDPERPGLYRAQLPLDRPGLYEIRLTARRSADTFTATRSLTIPGAPR